MRKGKNVAVSYGLPTGPDGVGARTTASAKASSKQDWLMVASSKMRSHPFILSLPFSIADVLKRQKRGILDVRRKLTRFDVVRRIGYVNALYQCSRRSPIVEKPHLVTKGKLDWRCPVQIQDVFFHDQFPAPGNLNCGALFHPSRIRSTVHMANNVAANQCLPKKKWPNNIAISKKDCRGRTMLVGLGTSSM